ncbi:MAG: response regulator [Leifsonia sp.]
MKILIADDDPQILRALSITLSAHGYEVVIAHDGRQAISAAASQHPDLIVLDLGMPHLTGQDVILAVRGWSAVPILVVSGRTDSADKVDALDAGADDYVTKPFAVDELLARIRALTRRTPTQADEPVVRLGPVTVDLAAHQVLRETDGAEPAIVRLTPTEWKMLEVLARNPRRLVTRNTLLTEVWGPQYTNDTGYLRLYVSQLRKKLEADPARPRHILTESGMGYRFVPDED